MSDAEIKAWFEARLPRDVYTGPVEVMVDRDEVLVVGDLGVPADAASDARDGGDGSGGSTQTEDGDAVRAARTEAHLTRRREETRAARMQVAAEAEHRFGRKVSWGAVVAGERVLFTHVSVPVMTRLRMPERRLLDTLVEAGVARSRSEATSWCVRLVAEREDEWLQELTEALGAVRAARVKGPGARRSG